MFCGIIFVECSDVLATGDGQDVEFVIEDKAVVARTKGEDEALVETSDDGVVRGCTVSGVNVLQNKCNFKKCILAKIGANVPWSSYTTVSMKSSSSIAAQPTLRLPPFLSFLQEDSA